MSLGNESRIVLVTGATGKQGGAVLRHLAAKHWKIRALTRNPESRAAQALKAQGVEVMRGDLEDARSLPSAVTGAYGVYSVQDFWSVGARREILQGKNLADAAAKAGVGHFVYSSVGGAERGSGIDHWESKWEVEKHLKALKLPVTILRPAAFMENYYIREVEIGILKGKLLDPIRADKPYQTIASQDIGAFAALAFDRPKDFLGLELEIAGSELTNPQAAEVFSRVMGRPVKFRKLPMLAVKLFLGKEFYQMFRWFNDAGFRADIPSLKRKYPEVPLMDLETWLYHEGWDKRGRIFVPPRE
jgi:uncharacterized protein YbjT (DUF2867 family)